MELVHKDELAGFRAPTAQEQQLLNAVLRSRYGAGRVIFAVFAGFLALAGAALLASGVSGGEVFPVVLGTVALVAAIPFGIAAHRQFAALKSVLAGTCQALDCVATSMDVSTDSVNWVAATIRTDLQECEDVFITNQTNADAWFVDPTYPFVLMKCTHADGRLFELFSADEVRKG